MQTLNSPSAADLIEARRLLLRRQKGAAKVATESAEATGPSTAPKAEEAAKVRVPPSARKRRTVLGDWVLTQWSDTQFDPRN